MGVINPYVRGLYFLRFVVVVLTFGGYKYLRSGIVFLTFRGYKSLRWEVLFLTFGGFSSYLGVINPYVRGLYLLLLGVVVFAFWGF